MGSDPIRWVQAPLTRSTSARSVGKMIALARSEDEGSEPTHPAVRACPFQTQVSPTRRMAPGRMGSAKPACQCPPTGATPKNRPSFAGGSRAQGLGYEARVRYEQSRTARAMSTLETTFLQRFGTYQSR